VQLEHYLIQLESEFIQLLAERSVAYTGAEIRNIVKESATEAFANGHPRLVSSDRLLTLLDLKPPQFRHDTEELEALRKWAALGGAEFAAPSDSSNTPPVTSDSNSLREVSWY
ncbi:MAG TPA: hypothetical protein DD990_28935, partial [Cyanobacteria bacterium UBA11368]|nr:hypothetical protein [Cyanobacteria bacterium UBA11368]